jgi:hypothetical protein
MGGRAPAASPYRRLNVNNQFFRQSHQRRAYLDSGEPSLNGGTANVNCVTNSTVGLHATLTVDGGTLNMAGHNIGSDASPISAVNLNSGTITNVARVSGNLIAIGSTVNVGASTTYAMAAGGTLNSSKGTLVLGSGGGMAGGSTASQATINGNVEAASGARVSDSAAAGPCLPKPALDSGSTALQASSDPTTVTTAAL